MGNLRNKYEENKDRKLTIKKHSNSNLDNRTQGKHQTIVWWKEKKKNKPNRIYIC